MKPQTYGAITGIRKIFAYKEKLSVLEDNLLSWSLLSVEKP